VAAHIPPFDALPEFNACRRKLLDLHLIGVDPNGIGFGNLSVRDGTTDNFHITGSATGGVHELTPEDCAKVVACNFEKNLVRYQGSVIHSSESLTHAAIYEADTTVGAVIHCHDPKLWEVLLNQAPTTSNTAECGTPELAYEIMRLFKHANAQSRKVVVLAGHESGIVTLGKDMEEAFTVLMCERKKVYL
jgi:ribulose-5-phosphate 4-epimerase/fuculose-1-phosphate aldolase